MVRSLEQLRAEKEALLRKQRGKESLENHIRKRATDRKILLAEINALRHPKSQTAKRVAKNLSIKSAKLIGTGTISLFKHLSKVARENDRPTTKKTSKNKRK